MNSNKNTRMQKVKPNPKKRPSKSQNAQPNPQKKQGAQRQVGASIAYSSGQVGKAPRIVATRDNCRIVHRELIASIVGSADFSVEKTLELNPGIGATFPWLSTMAQSWERYKFHKLRFCYYTRTGTTTPGSFMMAPDYDAADSAPISEQVASSYEGVSEDAPWKDNVCEMNASKMHSAQKQMFIRTEALADNLDIKTYDVGKMFVITIDGTAVPWGKLWVEYDVEFMIPQLPPVGFNQLVGGLIQAGGTKTAGNPLGTVPVPDGETRGATADGASTITFENAGQYLVPITVAGTTITAISGTTSGAGSSVSTSLAVINAGATAMYCIALVRTIAPNQSFTYSVTAATVTGGGIFFAQVPVGSIS